MLHHRFRLAGLVIVVAFFIAACGSDEDPAEAADDPTPPAIAAGQVTDGQVEIDGVDVDYSVAVPADFEAGSSAPVLLAFPPGGQDPGVTRALVDQTYAPEALRLGWVVVSPAAPDGELFFRGSETILPGFVDWVETWVEPEGGAPHIAGVSNGGLSSFRYAALNPDRVLSIIAFPGFAGSDADVAALSMFADVPVRLFAGETDTSWIEGAEETVEAFEVAGGDIELVVFPGEGHVMSSTADGTIIFDLLESFRTTG